MESGQNRMYVRKYYKSHRRDIISHKTIRACRLYGRIPFASTILEHDVPLQALTAAFGEWQESRVADDVLAARRTLRFMRVLTQLKGLQSGAEDSGREGLDSCGKWSLTSAP